MEVRRSTQVSCFLPCRIQNLLPTSYKLLDDFSIFMLIVYSFFLMVDVKSLSNSFQSTICPSVKTINLARKQAITIYQKVMSQSNLYSRCTISKHREAQISQKAFNG